MISNVLGPLVPQFMAGTALERMTPFGVLYHGVGLILFDVPFAELSLEVATISAGSRYARTG